MQGQEKEQLVLVIEDDLAIRELMNVALSEEGYRIEMTDSGIEGLRLAQHLHPSVIILDLYMGGTNTLGVLQDLRSGLETRQIPVIVTSATIPERLPSEQQWVISVADRYLQKPFDLDNLLDCVSSLCGKMAHPAIEDQDPASSDPNLPDQC